MSRQRPTLGRALAVAVLLALATPAGASIETPAAKAEASAAAYMASIDMEQVFGAKRPKAGQYLWRMGSFSGEPRLVISIPDQLAYLYRDDALIAVAAISTGVDEHPTPTGIFSVLVKKPMHRSIKYDNAQIPAIVLAMAASGYLPSSPSGSMRSPASGRR
jgi:L,D-transpeptidase catalytic domain